VLVILADRRFKLGHGRAFALYVAAYTVGRFWIEYLRVDDAHHIAGLRLNDWVSLLVFVAAVVAFVISARRAPGRETTVEPGASGDDARGDGTGPSGETGKETAPEPGQASGATAPDPGETGTDTARSVPVRAPESAAEQT
ncbi:MAG: prolipoprotein diacylglyceryl transferase family protein, partial [Streptomyces sp.]|uniref:prolipoprotein diacylglyceryl transferase family protein n=1 Tax=Streptomyces sp. TaxID=1931 RepID=UPI003D6B9989